MSKRNHHSSSAKDALVVQLLRKILKVLEEIAKEKCTGARAARFDFVVGQPVNKQKEQKMLELNCTSEQKINVQLKPVTATGQPAEVEAGSVLWEVLDGPSTVRPSEDGMNADLISSDEADTLTTYKVSADADLGSGVQTITDTISLRVSHPLAASLGLTASEPVAK